MQELNNVDINEPSSSKSNSVESQVVINKNREHESNQSALVVTEPVANTSNLSTPQEVVKNVNNESTSCVHEHESTQSALEESIPVPSTSQMINENINHVDSNGSTETESDDGIVFEKETSSTSSPEPFRFASVKNVSSDWNFSCIRRKCHIKKCESQEMFTENDLNQHIAEAHSGKSFICQAYHSCLKKFKTR